MDSDSAGLMTYMYRPTAVMKVALTTNHEHRQPGK